MKDGKLTLPHPAFRDGFRVRVIKPHRPECWETAQRNEWSPWWVRFDEPTEQRDALGRRNGIGEEWAVAECAISPECPASGLVRLRPMTRLAEAALGDMERGA